ncbi:MAG: alkane 1-monooxygenase, partial [Chitinophagaceae bacterium]|nr:alkane 1-monooxygenase [Chitinophagaceae bacterium]
GWVCYIPLLITWLVIPCVELWSKPDKRNLSVAAEDEAKSERAYDLILYLIVIVQWPALFLFLYSMQDTTLSLVDKVGRIGTMGLFCGTCGINVGHELGHRVNRFERTLAKFSLLSSLYMHNIVEHNKGHHKNIGTRADPSTARFGENLYMFWLRCIVFTYFGAWTIANQDSRKQYGTAAHPGNEMIQFHFIQMAFIGLIFLIFGWQVLVYFMLAALMGILLLQTVGYIEHYGLTRKYVMEGKFERVLPVHSWDSHHLLGRVLLFEVSRHRDHHYLASRKYQVLRYHDSSPQLPTGYPGMILLSLLPPIWFYIMNPRLKDHLTTRL